MIRVAVENSRTFNSSYQRKFYIIFLDSTKLKIVWKKITFLKRRVSIIIWSFSSLYHNMTEIIIVSFIIIETHRLKNVFFPKNLHNFRFIWNLNQVYSSSSYLVENVLQNQRNCKASNFQTWDNSNIWKKRDYQPNSCHGLQNVQQMRAYLPELLPLWD